MPHWMRRSLAPSRYADDDQRATSDEGPGGLI
jgi:hypothetical protein